jgi:uncharacterized protein
MIHEGVRPGSEASQPFHILAKPAGPLCNLACHYCFYLEKQSLFPMSSFRMTDDVLEEYTRQYIEGQPVGTPEVNFAWQGGEPTLMGVDFFRRALEFQRTYARPGLRILNSIQTNGTLLDDEWGEFLKENGFLVGISIDGPEEIHDAFRPTRGGRGSFRQVMRGLEILKAHAVSFNTLTCVQSRNADRPVQIYDFLRRLGSSFLQFIPIVEPDGAGGVTDRTVRPEPYGRFLCAIFDEWRCRNHVGRIFVRDFDVTLALTMGLPSPLCVHAVTCGRAVALEHNGDLFSCDHFVTPDRRLGNVMQSTAGSLVDSQAQNDFGADKRDRLPRHCRECEFLHLCNGGCPKDRIATAPDGEPGLNYLCESYRRFFGHSRGVFERMARALRPRRPARSRPELQQGRGSRAAVRDPLEPARNTPCPCGSGSKFKRCCGAAGRS